MTVPSPAAPRLVYVEVLGAHARQTPSKTALIDGSGRYTYAELWSAVRAVAAWLDQAGVRPGDRVVTAMAPSAPHLAVIFGIMAAGAVAVPLNVRLAAPEAESFLTPIEPVVIVADDAFAADATALAPRVSAEPLIVTLDNSDTPMAVEGGLAGRLGLLGDDGPAHTIPVEPGAPALIIGTGGTTGEPKGATWSHEGLWLYAASCHAQMEYRRTDVELYFSPFFHIAMATSVFAALYAGATAWILPRFHEPAVLKAIATGGPTRLFGAPTALLRLLDHPDFDCGATRSIRRVLFGSTVSTPDLPARLTHGFPAASLITGYGATEFGAVTRLRSWEFEAGRDTGVGRAVPSATITIVDDDDRPVPAGVVGGVVAQAPWQMLAYWARPQDSGATISPLGVRSGDLGWLDEDGFLHLAGRAKEMVISGGENIYPVEIESILIRHASIAQAAVFGVDDELWGERVEAAVVAAAGAVIDSAGLAAYCREHLAGYKVPRRFHVLPDLPLTPAMKVDKRRLRRDLHGV